MKVNIVKIKSTKQNTAKTLWERVGEETRNLLLADAEKYPNLSANIMEALHRNSFWNDLTIREFNSLVRHYSSPELLKELESNYHIDELVMSIDKIKNR